MNCPRAVSCAPRAALPSAQWRSRCRGPCLTWRRHKRQPWALLPWWVLRVAPEAGKCNESSLLMGWECLKPSNEDQLTPDMRGRNLVEAAVPEAVSRKLFQFAPEAVVWGDGFGGQQRPFSQD